MSIEEIRGRLEAATPGPWTYTGKDESTTWIESPDADVLIHDVRGTGHMREDFAWIKASDAEFIAHAPEDVARLLSALESTLDLHRPHRDSDGETNCIPCSTFWPCATAKKIRTALKGGY